MPFYKKIYKDGFVSRTAGDMWEPKYRTTEFVDDLNKLLDAHLATLTRVWSNNAHGWFENEHPQSLKSALLWDVEELPKRECEHEPDDFVIRLSQIGNGVAAAPMFVCRKCGAKLKAKWEVVE